MTSRPSCLFWREGRFVFSDTNTPRCPAVEPIAPGRLAKAIEIWYNKDDFPNRKKADHGKA